MTEFEVKDSKASLRGVVYSWISLSILLIAMCGAYLILRPREYESSAVIFVGATTSLSSLEPDLSVLAPTNSMKDYVHAILVSDSCRAYVVDQLALKSSSEFWQGKIPEKNSRYRAIRKLKKETVTVVNRMKDPIRVTSITGDPALSKKIVAKYLDFLTNKIGAGVTRDKTYWEQQLAEAQARVKKTEESLRKFEAEHEVYLDQRTQASVEFSSVVELSKQLALNAAELRAVEAELNAPGSINQQFDLTRQKAALSARDQELEATIQQQKDRFADYPQLSSEYRILLRDLKIGEEDLIRISAMYRQVSLSDAEKAPPFEVIDYPEEALEPNSRKWLSIALLSTAAGLFVATIFMLLTSRSFRRLIRTKVFLPLEKL